MPGTGFIPEGRKSETSAQRPLSSNLSVKSVKSSMVAVHAVWSEVCTGWVYQGGCTYQGVQEGGYTRVYRSAYTRVYREAYTGYSSSSLRSPEASSDAGRSLSGTFNTFNTFNQNPRAHRLKSDINLRVRKGGLGP